MAIVHPAFCEIALDPMEPFTTLGFAFFRGYKTFQKPRVQLKNR